MRALLALLTVVLALLLAGGPEEAHGHGHGHGSQASAEAAHAQGCGAASKACASHALHCAAMPAVASAQPAGPRRVSPAPLPAPRGLSPGRRDPPQPRPPLLSAA
jgi:hypothetical protein